MVLAYLLDWGGWSHDNWLHLTPRLVSTLQCISDGLGLHSWDDMDGEEPTVGLATCPVMHRELWENRGDQDHTISRQELVAICCNRNIPVDANRVSRLS